MASKKTAGPIPVSCDDSQDVIISYAPKNQDGGAAAVGNISVADAAGVAEVIPQDNGTDFRVKVPPVPDSSTPVILNINCTSQASDGSTLTDVVTITATQSGVAVTQGLTTKVISKNQ